MDQAREVDDEDDTAGLAKVQRDASSNYPLNDAEETIMKTLTTLLTRTLPGISTFVTTSALCLSAWVPAASLADEARYEPIDAITYEFGSKSIIGYFVQQAGTCDVTLMLAEKSDPEEMQPTSPTRLRLVLQPGQVAGLDSEEGRSLNVTCSEDTATLRVDLGETGPLVAQQARARQSLTAKAQRK